LRGIEPCIHAGRKDALPSASFFAYPVAKKLMFSSILSGNMLFKQGTNLVINDQEPMGIFEGEKGTKVPLIVRNQVEDILIGWVFHESDYIGVVVRFLCPKIDLGICSAWSGQLACSYIRGLVGEES
jgi:hypothetical protein